MVGISVRWLLILLLLVGSQVSQAADSPPQSMLVIDPPMLNLGEVDGAKPIEASLLIRNISEQPVFIANLSSSCGCTNLRTEAMTLPAGGFTPLHVTIDLFAKQGKIAKQVTVTDAFGGTSSAKILFTVRPNPHTTISNRSLFEGKCARCHFDPAKGLQQGKALYQALCTMCHGTNGSGAYAPKLRGLNANRLTSTITNGAGRPAMPAFAQQHGGPLSNAQIKALVNWLR